MAHSHYVMDLYFPDGGPSNRPRREALRIVADNDEAAVLEGQRIESWRKPASFQIRSIRSSSRTGDKLIYSSPAPADANVEPVERVLSVPE